MTSDTRDLSNTDQIPPRVERVQLSAVQVAASTLASVSAAVVASLFGVTGTVVGAGLVAVLSTTGSALYSASMKRTSDQLRRAREQLLTARPPMRSGSTAPLTRTRQDRTSQDRTPLNRTQPNRSQTPSGPQAAASTGTGTGRTIDLTDGADTERQALLTAEDTPAQPQSRWRRGWLTVGGRRGLKWPALVGAAVLVFAIAIGAITAFEAITQEPISALTGNSSSSSTTIGSLTGGSAAPSTPTPSPTQTGSGSDAGSTTPSPSATSSSGSGSGSSSSKATSTASPQPSASVAPSNAVPQPSSGSGSGSGTSGSSGSGSGPSSVPLP